MTEPILPARLAFNAGGVPWSEAYGDVYHSAAGGPAQAAHVFLNGTGLPERWRGRARFTILETGFGAGLNFLATWRAWRDDPQRCARLDIVSIEKHPFLREDLSALHERTPALAPLAAQLHAQWPLPLAGMHRLVFEAGRVVLTLLFGDIARALPQLRLAADAIYLDGFAPSRNEAMWTGAVMKGLARAAAPGAMAATWSTAAVVRGGLEGAGFEVTRAPGFADKREMLVARWVRAPGSYAATAGARPDPPATRHAAVIGAGMAGAAVAAVLAARGWRITLFERSPGPAQAASGNHAGVFHPVVSPDDNHLARLTRAGTFAALAHWRALEAAGASLRWDCCGTLQLARDAREAASQQRALAALQLPEAYVRAVSRDAATRLAGLEVAAGGLWFPESGWMQPARLVREQLAACGGALELRCDTAVAALEQRDDAWTLHDAAGTRLARAPVVIVAAGLDSLSLVRGPHLELRRVRGQISHLDASRVSAPRAVVLRGGGLLPAVDGLCVAGATYDVGDDDPAPRVSAHAANLARIDQVAPGAAAGVDPATLDGRVGFRAVTADRLPLVGALPAPRAPAGAAIRLPALERQHGLYAATGYGSRGLVWSALAAELLASQIEGEPPPLEGALIDALDPGRFAVRALRRRSARGG